MSNKAAFLLGDFDLNALDYDTKEEVKNFFNLVFQNEFHTKEVVTNFLIWFSKMDFYPSSKDLRELLEQAPLQLTMF